jgi:hypothetical protein
MPQEPPAPTDPDREATLGRVALWLEPEDLRWLTARCCCADDASEAERQRCARVRFRAAAALHKASERNDLLAAVSRWAPTG